jgi:2-dehydro-3-deoxyphosphooctonate aldolase (KDO 8-P synthase)
MEVHPNPQTALCDGPNSQSLDGLKPLLEQLVAIDRVVKGTQGA